MISALPARLLVALLPMAPETVENETLKFLALVSNDWKIGFLFCDWLRLTGVCAPYIGFDSAIFHFNYSDLIGFSNILIFRIKFSKFMRLSKFEKKTYSPTPASSPGDWSSLARFKKENYHRMYECSGFYVNKGSGSNRKCSYFYL